MGDRGPLFLNCLLIRCGTEIQFELDRQRVNRMRCHRPACSLRRSSAGHGFSRYTDCVAAWVVGRPSRVLYITHAPPVPSRLGPARRHYHLLDQLTRFYDVELLSLGTASEEDVFAARFGNRVAGFQLYARRALFGRTWSKSWRTLTGRCDFLPALEPELRGAAGGSPRLATSMPIVHRPRCCCVRCSFRAGCQLWPTRTTSNLTCSARPLRDRTGS